MATKQDILSQLNIAPDDWVLEIGGGPTPFARSDILADRFIEDDTHRAAPLVVDRLTVACDAHALPFLDDSFDYVFCSQILEHLEDPKLFCNEIARVAKKGYIETPNEIRERLFGWPFHRWIVDTDEDGLVLRKNNVEQAFGLFFHRLQWENYEFSRFCSTAHDLLNICYEWHGKPSFRFAKEGEYELPDEKVSISTNDVVDVLLSKPYKNKVSNRFGVLRKVKSMVPKRLKSSLKQRFASSAIGGRHSEISTYKHLLAVLACPICKVKVDFNKECGQYYNMKDGIHFMLAEGQSV
jgi:SAM-dependent methyltransferase